VRMNASNHSRPLTIPEDLGSHPTAVQPLLAYVQSALSYNEYSGNQQKANRKIILPHYLLLVPAYGIVPCKHHDKHDQHISRPAVVISLRYAKGVVEVTEPGKLVGCRRKAKGGNHSFETDFCVLMVRNLRG
jgi:hypothetical protein